jgi:hypothetical protein
MELEINKTLATYRLVIGYLGERERFGWWQSSFFTQGSDAFLSPLFGRTQTLAQCNGVTQAAALIHDERIGIGNVYHLFRLPEDMEQGIHQILHDVEFTKELRSLIPSNETALVYLRKQAVEVNPAIGPTRVGKVESLRDKKVLTVLASYYLNAFENGQEIFPYFTDVS